jgi:hypothetical protein
MNDLEQFSRGYLQQWESLATVRGRERFRLSEAALRHDLYPAAQLPLIRHPDVVALGEGARRELLVRTALDFQRDVARLEVDVVAELCGGLANRKFRVALPETTRQVALTIGTDEVYHAYVAREFVADVERLTGFASQVPDGHRPPIVKALDRIRQEAPAELVHEAEIMVLCFAENFVVEELFGMSKGIEVDDPFRIIVREHLIDEGRHQVFFQRLMRHMWAALDEEARIALGRLIPGLLDAFLLDVGGITESYNAMLGFLGFDRERGIKIIREAFVAEYGAWDGRKYAIKPAQRSLHLLEVAGILEHAPTRAVLVESAWAAP